jgi:hypothetical protein
LKIEQRIDLLTGEAGRRLYTEAEANAIGVGVLASQPDVDVVVIAAHDVHGRSQEWSVNRSGAPHTTTRRTASPASTAPPRPEPDDLRPLGKG